MARLISTKSWICWMKPSRDAALLRNCHLQIRSVFIGNDQKDPNGKCGFISHAISIGMNVPAAPSFLVSIIWEEIWTPSRLSWFYSSDQHGCTAHSVRTLIHFTIHLEHESFHPSTPVSSHDYFEGCCHMPTVERKQGNRSSSISQTALQAL
jgi:hypothetical protein